MNQAITAPETLIDSQGQPRYGHFEQMVRELAPERFDYRNVMDKSASKLARYFHYKQFQFVSVVSERYLIGIAIADIRYLCSAFCYVVDLETGQLVEQNWLRPLFFDSSMQASPYEGKAHIANQALMFDIKQGQWRVVINAKWVKADMVLLAENNERPLAMCTPTGYQGWTYTQKHNALKVGGELSVFGKAVELKTALAGYDFSAGYMRRETSWRWASINTQQQGIRLGLNLAGGVNETGGCENVLWVEGERHFLPAVYFDFDRLKPNDAWRIYSADKRIDLTFTPMNCRKEKLNLLVLKSNFRQFVGHFDGVLKGNDGAEHRLENVLGLTEDHFACW
ncbi:TPA: DUF2804 domain-containing protein [Vibrio vulnificus]|uniref:DUF2804 domain-containing protein n=1 Tax=Vibrio vulnificus TaxID=672 RepID=UPI000C7A466A|nr:DUF2804 domain-containing protein [Vibrio vulnificus]AUJ37369.1 hypothetical protein BWZ32_21390 [Vibrio vulnificus]MBN8088719.1 DUF2804 domain-containing protein [Vibrio vulnificus]MBN8117757.1 DUF2804 domain-containing protein [Vibrio vulnificus]HAS6155879.1 DUF2804 family protein [Vibrio vulnificus]HDY7422176.1 DUF2804 domain-containing protein [Vibrio vulnificus]